MSTNTQSYLFLHVAIRVAPKDVTAFLEALRPCWEGCINEPECLFFDVTQDPEIPGSFRFVEAWNQSKEWFMQHQITKPYYGPYLEITTPMFIAERQGDFFESVPGFCAINPGYLAGARQRRT